MGGEDGQTIELNICCRVKKPQAPAARGDWMCYLLLCVLWDENKKSERAHGVVIGKVVFTYRFFPGKKRVSKTLTVPLVIMNSFPSSVFHSEANWETKKHSLYCGKFRSILVGLRTQKRLCRVKQSTSMTKQDFPVKTKHQSLTSLASI